MKNAILVTLVSLMMLALAEPPSAAQIYWTACRTWCHKVCEDACRDSGATKWYCEAALDYTTGECSCNVDCIYLAGPQQQQQYAWTPEWWVQALLQ